MSAYVGSSKNLKDLKDWKGEVFAYVGLPQNLKDLKDSRVVFERFSDLFHLISGQS